MNDAVEPEVLVERSGAIVTVRLNRPHRLNALTETSINEAAEAIENARDARAIVLTGAGRAFSSGADLAPGETGETDPARTVDAANRLVRAIREVPVPVIAAVNGPVAGGSCSFVLAADLSIGSESAYLYFAWVRNALMPDAGAHALLASSIGHVRAWRVALRQEKIYSAKAVEMGLMSYVVPDDEFASRVRVVAEELAQGPTAAYAWAKRTFSACAAPALEQAFALERQGQSDLFRTEDVREGYAAFQERRAPSYVGH